MAQQPTRMDAERAEDDVDLELLPDGQLSAEPRSFEDEPELGDGAVFSSNHSRRGMAREADRMHGPKTARANKDLISRR